jgi:hypothetical protein
MATYSDVIAGVQSQINAISTYSATAMGNVSTFLTDLQGIIASLQNLIPFLQTVDHSLELTGFAPATLDVATNPVTEPTPDSTEKIIGTSMGEPSPTPLDPYSPTPIDLNTIPEFQPLTFPSLPTFTWLEPVYVSELNSDIAAKLLADVLSGADGLAPAWESSMITRMRTRDETLMQTAIQRLKNVATAFGFNTKQGSLDATMNAGLEDYEDTKLDQARDALIQKYESMLNYAKFTLSTSLTYEDMMIAHCENVNNRALDAAKATIQFAIEVYKSYLEAYNSYINQMKAEFELKMDVAKIEIGEREYYLKSFIANLQQYKINTDLMFKQIEMIIEKYNLDTQKYSHNVRMVLSQSELNIRQYDFAQKSADTMEDMGLQTAQENIKAFIEYAEIATKASETGGSIWASAAAGALNALNTLVTLGDQVGSSIPVSSNQG